MLQSISKIRDRNSPASVEAMDDLSAVLPLSPRVFAILALLAEGPAHGYGIKQEVETRSAGAIRMDPGSLYRNIGRMASDGWIEETTARPDPSEDDPRRRYYALTPLGRTVLSAEAERLADLVASARGRA